MKPLLLAMIFLLLISCRSKQETIRPTVQSITESVYASGIVKSKNQYQVFSSVNGIIERVHVTEGDIVRKGDAIITLVSEASKLTADNARLMALYSSEKQNTDRLNELKVNIDLAKTKMESDSVFLQRQRKLWEQSIGSRNELDQRELALKNSVTAYKASLLRYNELKKEINFSARQSRKNLEISNVLANDFTIRAKQNGKVYTLFKERGEMVNTQTPVAVIGEDDQFMMELQVDEYDIAKIKPKQKVFVTMDSYKSEVFEAVIDKIDPIMNDRLRSFKVEASFTSQPPRLYPNLTVEANILINTKENAVTIPRSYLVDESYVLLKSGEKRKVVTGLKDYQRAEVVSGLTTDVILAKPAE
jgi:HlyD family secretion protein